MFYRVPLAHLLGGSGMAYFSSAYSIFMPVYAITVSGIPPAVAKLTAESLALGRYSDARRLRAAAITFFFFVGFAATVALTIFSKPICDYIIAEPQSRISVAAIAPCIVIGAVASVERGYAEGSANYIPTAVSEIIEAIVKLAAGLGFAVIASKKADADFASVGEVFGIACQTADEARAAALPVIAAASVAGITLSNVCGCCYLWLSRKLRGDGITDERLKQTQVKTPRRELLKNLLELAAPLAIASVITTLSGVIDLLTINRCLDYAFESDRAFFLKKFTAAVAELSEGEKLSSFIYGSYSGLALTVFGIVPSLTAMFGRSILPAVSSCYAKSDEDGLASNIKAVMTMALFVCVPCGLAISVFSKEILCMLFSGRSAEIAVCADVLAVLGAAVIPVSLTAPAFTIFQSAGMPHEPIKITLVGCAVKLAGNLLLVRKAGLNITGAGLATLICYSVMLAMCAIKLKKLCGKNHPVAGIKNVVNIFLSSLLAIEAAYLVYELCSQSLGNSISLIAAAVFSVNIYIQVTRILSVLPKSF